MDYEMKYLEQGQQVIVGMDEAGYGAWAGPVVAGAVCLPLADDNLTTRLRGVKDSKQMTRRQREAAVQAIQQCAMGYCIGQADPTEITEQGLSHALNLAYNRAFEGCIGKLNQPVQVILIDGRYAWRGFEPEDTLIERIPKGDTLSLSIAAASVLAKVWRDKIMQKLGAAFPAYGFENHVGYGTAAHRAALEQHGVLQGIHRQTYKPIAKLLEQG